MEKLADHFKELLEADAEGFLSGPGHCDSTMIQSFGAPNLPGIHEEKTAPSAKDPCAAAAGAAEERLSSKF